MMSELPVPTLVVQCLYGRGSFYYNLMFLRDQKNLYNNGMERLWKGGFSVSVRNVTNVIPSIPAYPQRFHQRKPMEGLIKCVHQYAASFILSTTAYCLPKT